MGRQSGEPLEVFRRAELVTNNLVLMMDLERFVFLTEKAIKLYRTIRTGKLKALLPLHTRPINVVVFHGS